MAILIYHKTYFFCKDPSTTKVVFGLLNKTQNTMLEVLQEPWPWYTSGAVIAGVMVALIFFGKSFGFSSNFRHICAIGGAGKFSEFFRYDWKAQRWNLLFLVGAVMGGFISSTWISDDSGVDISEATKADLAELGIAPPTGLQPEEIFSWAALTEPSGWIMMVLGGFLIGFGTRYAGGCTSGHAISGLSNLQLPSLVAVIGFFIGGLFSTFVLLPIILG
ncbi:MAG: putative membrane protein YedE/YeeE [Cryomorphaceae bacterium]